MTDSVQLELDNLSIALIKASGALGGLRLAIREALTLVMIEDSTPIDLGNIDGRLVAYVPPPSKDTKTLARIKRILGSSHAVTYEHENIDLVCRALWDEPPPVCHACGHDFCKVWGTV